MSPQITAALRTLASFTLALSTLAALGCDDPARPSMAGTTPLDWRVEREPSNPVIRYSDNPGETISQYVPAPIRLPNGDIWIYVKGDVTQNVSAYRSRDGVRFEFMGTAVPKGPPGSWDQGSAIDPVALYDPAADVIHLWYKGATGQSRGDLWSWGHATARGADPLHFTKGPEPILTPSMVASAFGERGVTHIYLSDVVRIDGRTYFYGGYGNETVFKIFLAVGDSWTDPRPMRVLLAPDPGYDVVQCPQLLRDPRGQGWHMIYTVGYDADHDPNLGRSLRVAHSDDGITWREIPGTFLTPDQTFSWEAKRVYCGAFLEVPGGDFATPELRGGRMLFYYSGSSLDHKDQTGLLRLYPDVRR